MNQYYVYILKCSDDSYYTGVTNNLNKRINQHNLGVDITSYTYKRRPLQLAYFELFKDIEQAIAFEKQIKGWSRKKKEALIKNNWQRIKEYSACNNDTSHKHFDSVQCDNNGTK